MPGRRTASDQLKLTLRYVSFSTLSGFLLLTAVALFILRYIPEGDLYLRRPDGSTTFVPDRSDLLNAYVPVAAAVIIFLIYTPKL